MSAITIGPYPYKDELNFAVGDMTSRSGLVVHVSSSEVLFRNW
jgi:hypothetical protein